MTLNREPNWPWEAPTWRRNKGEPTLTSSEGERKYVIYPQPQWGLTMKDYVKLFLGFLAATALIYAVVLSIHNARAEGSISVWAPGAEITDTSSGKKYGMLFGGGRLIFKTQAECDNFRETNAEYKKANDGLEAKLKALGVDSMKIEYKCFEGHVDRVPGEESL